MKIWRLIDPRDRRFAWFDAKIEWVERPGTWSDANIPWESVSDRYGVCKECTAPPPSEPVVSSVMWEPGSDVIGDFSWDVSGGWPVATKNVFEMLCSRFKGISSLPVEYYQNPKVKRPARPNRRSKPRVWLPYDGPPQVQLIIKTSVHIDVGASSARRVKKCGACGHERWQVVGIEEKEHHWDIKRRLPFYVRHPRKPGKGIVVCKAALGKSEFFQSYEFEWSMCTDRVKTFIEENGITNVDFYEVGEII